MTMIQFQGQDRVAAINGGEIGRALAWAPECGWTLA